MLQGQLPAFSTLDARHQNLNFAASHLSSAGVAESQFKGPVEDAQVPRLTQFDQNSQDSHGMTQLHRAALSKDIEQIRSLLKAGADVGVHDLAGNTPLHCAIIAESIEIVLLILRFRPDVDAKNHQGRAPLHLAISQPAVINALVDNGADVSVQDEKGDTPLHLALSTDSPDYAAVDILLKSDADSNKENKAEVTPFLKLLDRPCSQEVLSTICSFLEAGGSIQQTLPDGRTPLQIFLSRSENCGFRFAGAKNKPENTILRHFLAKGASVVTPIPDGEPLILNYCDQLWFGKDYDRSLGKVLFKRLIPDEVRKVGNSLLLTLVSRNYWLNDDTCVGTFVQILLNHGANPNHQNVKGETPLILLCDRYQSCPGIPDTLASLLKHGANPWQRDYSGTCALYRAAENFSEAKYLHVMLETDLGRRRSAHPPDTELRDPTESEAWVEWQEAVLAADWSGSKRLMLRESEADSDKASKKLRDCALQVLAKRHTHLAKGRFQGQVGETELRRRYVAGIMRDCRDCGITLDVSCTDYLIELCLE